MQESLHHVPQRRWQHPRQVGARPRHAPLIISHKHYGSLIGRCEIHQLCAQPARRQVKDAAAAQQSPKRKSADKSWFRSPQPDSIGSFRFWHDEKRFKGTGENSLVQIALLAAGRRPLGMHFDVKYQSLGGGSMILVLRHDDSFIIVEILNTIGSDVQKLLFGKQRCCCLPVCSGAAAHCTAC